MIKSMTAFTSISKTEGPLTINVEIRSYNSRYLDINLRIYKKYLSLEEKIKSLITKHIERGRIEIKISVANESEEAFSYEVNTVKAQAYYQSLKQLSESLNLKDKIPVELVFGAGDLIKPAECSDDLENEWSLISESLTSALTDLDKMRGAEGQFTSDDLKNRLAYIEKSVKEIEKDSDNLLDIYRNKLEERMKILTKGLIEIDETRITQEAAFLADKSDISEETVRVRSHINQFRKIIEAKGPAGRKLNFLLQEFNREFNTMGSKIGNAGISHLIVDVKSELEKLREQVQNIE